MTGIGVVAGSYSTIFIACPVLLWLMNRPTGETGKGSSAVKAA